MEKKRVGIIGRWDCRYSVGIQPELTSEYWSQLFEKDQIGSGTTAKSAATVCLLDDSIKHDFWDMRLFGFQSYERMEQEEKRLRRLR
jgi:hypothetical protein